MVLTGMSHRGQDARGPGRGTGRGISDGTAKREGADQQVIAIGRADIEYEFNATVSREAI